MKVLRIEVCFLLGFRLVTSIEPSSEYDMHYLQMYILYLSSRC